jgi:hypothetical protein
MLRKSFVQVNTMATRSEEFRAAEQRGNSKKRAKPRKGRSKPGSKPSERSREKKHAGRKATVALEESAARPSRKSTRSSANRAKADANFNLREEARGTSPDTRYRKARAKSARVRGKR